MHSNANFNVKQYILFTATWRFHRYLCSSSDEWVSFLCCGISFIELRSMRGGMKWNLVHECGSTHLPMSSLAQLAFAPLISVRWRVRLWVQGPLERAWKHSLL